MYRDVLNWFSLLLFNSSTLIVDLICMYVCSLKYMYSMSLKIKILVTCLSVSLPINLTIFALKWQHFRLNEYVWIYATGRYALFFKFLGAGFNAHIITFMHCARTYIHIVIHTLNEKFSNL